MSALDNITTALRVPPHSEEAERGVLGSILLSPSQSLNNCIKVGLHAQDFYDRRHQVLYEQMMELRLKGGVMDAITIGEHLKRTGTLDKVGGYDYLVFLQSDTLVAAHVTFYAEIVLEKRLYRRLIDTSAEAMDSAYSEKDTALSLMNETRGNLFAIDRAEEAELTNAEAAELALARWRRIRNGETFGLPWHVSAINNTFGNFLGYGNPFFIAAEPGGGKSVNLQNLFETWVLAEDPFPCACASLEMTKEKFIARMMSSQARVNMWSLENGQIGRAHV